MNSCTPIGRIEEEVQCLLTGSYSGLAPAGSQALTQPLAHSHPAHSPPPVRGREGEERG